MTRINMNKISMRQVINRHFLEQNPRNSELMRRADEAKADEPSEESLDMG